MIAIKYMDSRSFIGFVLKKKTVFLIFMFFIIFINPDSIYSYHSVLLKSGKTIKGIIQEQNSKSVTIKLENGIIESIDKSRILIVIYKKITPEEEAKIRITEEKKILESKPKTVMEFPPNQQNHKAINDNMKFDLSIPNKETRIMLFTDHGKNCIPYASQTEWFWLYGTLPISTVDWSELLPKEKNLIRIRWESSWNDIVTTIFLGTLTSISRKTITIDICELELETNKNKKYK